VAARRAINQSPTFSRRAAAETRSYNRRILRLRPAHRRLATERVSRLRVARLLVWLCLALIVPVTDATAEIGQWRLFTSDDGLPETWTYHLARGASGRIWASHGVTGLAEYDGYHVQIIPTTQPALRLSEAPDGRLWALVRQEGTQLCAGVQRWNGKRWEAFPMPELSDAAWETARLVAWAPDRILVLTPGRLIELDAAAHLVRVVRSSRETTIGRFYSLALGRNGGAWIAGERGVAHVAPATSQTPYRWSESPLPRHGRRATWVYDTDRGLLVIGHDGEPGGVLMRLSDGKWESLTSGHPEQPLFSAWPGADGSIWVAHANSRAFRISVLYDTGREQNVTRMRALSGVLFDTLPDPDGGFWLATSLGLVRQLPSTWRTPPELNERNLHTGSLLETRNGDLYAIQDGALLRRTNGTWRVLPVSAERNPNVHYSSVLGELDDGRLVVGMEDPQEPLLFDPVKERFTVLQHRGGGWAEMLGTHVPFGAWMIVRREGQPAQIVRYDGGAFVPRIAADGPWEGDDRPRFILETRNGDLFVSPTPHGIGWARGTTWQWLDRAAGLPGAMPFTAVELSDGRIWFGGRDGIVQFDGHKFSIVRNGLQTVRSIIQTRDGTIWVASNSGIHRFFNGSWSLATNDEGLPDAAAFHLLEDRSGQVWVATSAGLSARYADADHDAPETVLSSDKNPRQAPPSGELRLVYEGVDRWRHTPPGRLVYSYRVDNQNWSPFVRDTGVALTGLGAGSHTFAVRAMDRNWNVDPTPATLTFTVLLPWYREPFVMALGLLGGIAFAVAIGLFVNRHVRLERLVLERTRALRAELSERKRIESERAKLEEQLGQSQKMEALGRLAGGISHDFNNLLTVIASYGDLLVDELSPGDPRRSHAEEIVKAGGRAAALTQQLLSFSRHQAVQRQVIDLNSLLSDLLRMLARVLGEPIELLFVPGDGLWHVLGDRGQLEQVVMNLALNARDSMPSGGLLSLETANVYLDDEYVREHVGSDAGPHVRLTVADTGIGMDEETRSRIFEPFFTTKARGKGSGLGLAMVYGIIHQLEGHIVVESEPDKGSRFEIYLPRTEQRAAVVAEPARITSRSGRETILLVEDEPSVRALAATALRRLGYTIIEAASAEDALTIFDRQPDVPNLVVTDVVMPGMDGRQLSTRLKARRPELPVLLMSGYTSENPIVDSSDASVAFLQKPFTPATLSRAVRALLDRTSSGKPTESRN
jgi:signal transduction histidine kinase/CheY-like chemotaxis protein/ligand-binding sensor domain-containing protein